ncbi:RNA-directed DNA polymerase, eukaryota, reverse transcriptase zinc-binding domain protein [Tanacetum coccineum]|uniref:RNA-directed DNA polymerase, eukaryota, reverse transcriptase zinc-binding domain protein n=1 Tax=Tanacetum coccineum TaxID=301880 RepID=A0ABQ5JC38_9ASTR
MSRETKCVINAQDLFTQKVISIEAESMCLEVHESEIKEALKSIDDNKAPELLKGYGRKQEKQRFAFKIDIMKAYDTMSWVFLEKILEGFGFPSKFIKWVMTCVKSDAFSVCVNEESFRYFMGGRSLRQGDPMSPYLFIIVMKVLNLIMQRKINQVGTFKYHSGCKDLKITNLRFADDLLILCNGDNESVSIIKFALEEFSSVYGL